jgi:hypothetical protein
MPVTINGTSGITTPGIDASGTNKFATTIGVGGATPAASGAGITFPAIQSASSNANTLDDYEEGTWTPAYQFVSGVTTQDARYVKIGLFVLVMFRFTWTGGSSGAITVTLPFTAGVGNPSSSGGCGSVFWQGPNAASFGPISPHTSGGSPTFSFYKQAASSFTTLDGSDVNGSYAILSTFSYMVDPT